MSGKTVESGTAIFQEGDLADMAYLIVSGKVEISQNERGQMTVTRTLGENEIFGELAVFDPNALRPYTAKATEKTELIPITQDEVTSLTANASKPVQALLSLAFEKMKLTRTKAVSKQNVAVTSAIKKITIAPDGEKMTALFKPMEVTPNRLPFRIGGYPEGGEASRRDTLHLAIPVQVNPLRVSRQHCEIVFDEGALVMVDLGSRFCTTVNSSIIGRGRGAFSAPLTMGKNKVTLGNADGNYTLIVTCE